MRRKASQKTIEFLQLGHAGMPEKQLAAYVQDDGTVRVTAYRWCDVDQCVEVELSPQELRDLATEFGRLADVAGKLRAEHEDREAQGAPTGQTYTRGGKVLPLRRVE